MLLRAAVEGKTGSPCFVEIQEPDVHHSVGGFFSVVSLPVQGLHSLIASGSVRERHLVRRLLTMWVANRRVNDGNHVVAPKADLLAGSQGALFEVRTTAKENKLKLELQTAAFAIGDIWPEW